MIRVVHATSVHPWDDIRIFRKMAVSLARAGYDTHLVAIDRDSDRDKEFLESGVTVHLLRGSDISGRFQRFRRGSYRVVDKAKSLSPTILHFHDPEMIPAVATSSWSGTSIIYDAHENLPGQIYGKHWIPAAVKPVFKVVAHSLEKTATVRFDGIVGATPAIASRFPRSKAMAIQNFPIAGEFSLPAAAKDEAKWQDRPNAGIYIGAVSYARGILPLLEGVGRSEKIERFDIVGNFETAQLLEQAKQTSGWAKVVNHGQVPRERLADLMRKARFGAVTFLPLPNHVDAQPNKMFEYLSAGLPVLASDFTLWRKILGENLAEYVDPKDPGSIACGVDRILAPSDSMQEQRSVNAFEAVKNTFNWDSEAERFLEYYGRWGK